jgi:hypothetical protein
MVNEFLTWPLNLECVWWGGGGGVRGPMEKVYFTPNL